MPQCEHGIVKDACQNDVANVKMTSEMSRCDAETKRQRHRTVKMWRSVKMSICRVERNVAVSKYDEETLQCHEVKDEMKMSQGQDVNNMMVRIRSYPDVKTQNGPDFLDDLFRKTKAVPCIYWLPLTESQIADRERERRQRQLEREQRRRELEKEEEAERKKRREMEEKRKERPERSSDKRAGSSDRARKDKREENWRPNRRPSSRSRSRSRRH